MSIIIDIILLSLIALFVLKYYRAGLALSIIGFVRFFIAIIIAVLVGNLFSSLINNITGYDGKGLIILGYLIAFFAAYIFISLLMKLISKIKIPIISFADRVLGGMLGLVMGVSVTSAVSVLLYAVMDFATKFNTENNFIDIYNNSVIFKFFCDFSIFEFIIDLI